MSTKYTEINKRTNYRNVTSLKEKKSGLTEKKERGTS